jgi:hypothetical protein
MGKMRNSYTILVHKSEGKRPLGRPRCRYEGNIRMDLRDLGWLVMDWIRLVDYRSQWWAFVNTIMKFQVLYKVGNS